MHFMLHRGAKASEIAPTLRLTNINPFDTNGEVKALAHTLTTLKGNAENIFNVHKHANNKRDHSNPNDNSYDPSVSRTEMSETEIDFGHLFIETSNSVQGVKESSFVNRLKC